jgi:hypothetical protein
MVEQKGRHLFGIVTLEGVKNVAKLIKGVAFVFVLVHMHL